MARAAPLRPSAMGRRFLALIVVTSLFLVASGCTNQQTPAATGSSTTSSSVSPTSVSSSPPPTVGTWLSLPPAPIPGSERQLGAWDGSELLIVEVATSPSGQCRDVAAAYKPAARTWRKISTPPVPPGCAQGSDVAVWTGRELILWGVTNAAYDPKKNHWRQLPTPPAGANGPTVAVWTGSQMVGWGGGCCGLYHAEGAAYTPASNSWRLLPAAPLSARTSAAGAWTGTEMIVAGGNGGIDKGGRIFADAAAYNPTTHTWRKLPRMPIPRTQATAVWDGTEVLIFGGFSALSGKDRYLSQGVAYNPSTDLWRSQSPIAYPRQGFVAEWTGHQVLVWGGRISHYGTPFVYPPHGEAYDPARNAWLPISRSPLHGRLGPVAAWTGAMMIVWGGFATGQDLVDGATFTPGTT